MHETFRASFGEAIVRQRAHLGFLQGYLAEKAGIDQGTLSRIETGKVRCDIVRGRQIAGALSITLAGLCALADEIDQQKGTGAALPSG